MSFLNPRGRLAFVVLIGAVTFLYSISAMTAPAPMESNAIKALLKERYETLAALTALVQKGHDAGQMSLWDLHEATRAMQQAELELCDTDVQRVTVLETIVANARNFEMRLADLSRRGEVPSNAPLKAKADRLTLEIALARLKS